MFAKMMINDYPKDCTRYQRIADEAIKGLPEKITARPYREENQLSFRIFYGSEQTDFYVSMKGDLFYYDKEREVLERVDTDDIRANFEAVQRSQGEN